MRLVITKSVRSVPDAATARLMRARSPGVVRTSRRSLRVRFASDVMSNLVSGQCTATRLECQRQVPGTDPREDSHAAADIASAEVPFGAVLRCVRSRPGSVDLASASSLTTSPCLRSSDGRAWAPVEFPTDEGYAKGYPDALFPTAGRLTVLLLRGAAAESTIATLLCARDGVTWHEGPAGAADLFDGAEVGDVIATEDGLIAVGVPLHGVSFVSTAAVRNSSDGLGL